jgi:hypothetical protein
MDVESLAKQLILKGMTEEQQMAVLESIKSTMLQARTVQKQRVGENVQVVVQALKKLESDIKARYDETGRAIEKRVASIKDGKDGQNGVNGKDGRDGRPGRDGATGPKGNDGLPGRNGIDGVDGVSVTNAFIDFDGSLIINLSNGQDLNVGEVVAPDLAEKIKVITNGGGTSQQVLDTLASLQTQINNLIPSQTGNAGKFLTTNGSVLSWGSAVGGLSYEGTWNASTNTPTLASGTGTNGYYYVVATAGSTNLDGITDWQIGDWLIFNGTVWQKIDQSNLVTSVNGQTGAVSLTTTNINEGTNLYYTDARARSAISAGTGISYDSATGVVTNASPDQTVSLTASTGISTSGTYPNFTITNTAPDQTVSLTGAGTTSISGTYPNFTITSADSTVGTVTSVSGTGTVSGISLSGTVTSSGNLTLGGTLDLSSPPTIGNTTPNTGRFTTLTVDDNTTLGSSNSDTVTFTARINSDFDPATDNAFDLGRVGHEWRDLYIDGTANIDSLIADTADINAGTIDNTSIGASTASTGAFTTLSTTGALTYGGVTLSNSVTGTGSMVLSNSPTLVTPALGTPASGVVTNLTGTASININGTVGATTASTGAFTTLSATGVTTVQAGTVSDPAITTTGDTNTGIFFPAADTIAFAEGGVEAMRIDSSGRLNIGTSVGDAFSSNALLRIQGADVGGQDAWVQIKTNVTGAGGVLVGDTDDDFTGGFVYDNATDALEFHANNDERARIDSDGNFMVGTTEDAPGVSNNTVGISARSNGTFYVSSAPSAAFFNVTSDGQIIGLRSGGTIEGNISVSGTTVSYNGGHLARWAQTTTAKDESLVKGTVLSNLDEMNVYTDADGNPVENEQLNKVKVSDVEGDTNVAGVFVNWDHDEAHNVDEINMAMTGDMIIRIAQGVTVARGDLLMSAGDGTAKPQGDDIVRSKTVAKVTSNNVTCTYADGSFCVPCVLMAC